ncbi:MAG: AI-2E family transporter [Gammaproteobacteria bacterium]|nr:AI-2E family transporter [Gammaproteobacteria bacterium]
MHSVFYRRCFQVATAVVLGYAVYRVLEPLLSVLGWAIVLAFILYPLQERLRRLLRGRAGLAAGILTVLTPFCVLLPLSMLAAVFARQVARVIESVRTQDFSAGELMSRAVNLPLLGRLAGWLRENASVSAEQIQGWASEGVQAVLKNAAATGGNVALGVAGTVIGIFMMLFVLFFLLRDGRGLLAQATRLVPTSVARRERLLNYLGEVTRAVVFGSTATAVIQGVIVGAGFALAHLPSPVVFGVLGMIAAFLPTGSALVLLPAILYLALTGRWGAAIFMVCWTGFLWLAENLLRPLLTARHTEVSTLAIFIGAIGGVAAFGILGLFIGPVLLSFALALARFAQESTAADA